MIEITIRVDGEHREDRRVTGGWDSNGGVTLTGYGEAKWEALDALQIALEGFQAALQRAMLP